MGEEVGSCTESIYVDLQYSCTYDFVGQKLGWSTGLMLYTYIGMILIKYHETSQNRDTDNSDRHCVKTRRENSKLMGDGCVVC